MPTNHGIYRKLPTTSGKRLTAAEAMVFRYGIRRIFDALQSGPFLTNMGERQRAAQLEYHFRTLCSRFVFTLQQLNGLMQELVQCRSPDQLPLHESMAIHLNAGCLADHIMTYLNMMIDDVAILVVLTTGYTPTKPSKTIDSMGKLRGQEVRSESALAPVKPLLVETDTPGSWWDLGFARGTGARQLVVHNQHLVDFQMSSVSGGPMEVQSVIMSPFAQNTFPCSDFFGLLRNILSGLFGWLDRLEAALVSHLQTRAASWSPGLNCPCIPLPVGYPKGLTRYDRDYFPIPVCDGSDELPWSVSVLSGNEAASEGRTRRIIKSLRDVLLLAWKRVRRMES